jgi:hypothetical protein
MKELSQVILLSFRDGEALSSWRICCRQGSRDNQLSQAKRIGERSENSTHTYSEDI